MWFSCQCGFQIHDNADDLYFKAHVIKDRMWNSFWDDIDSAIENSGPSAKDKEISCMNLRKKNVSVYVYQCPQCCRVHFQMESDNLVTFKPENPETPNKIFESE